MNIGDIFFKAFIEDKDLQLQAQKVGDQAGKTMGSRMSTAIGTAMRVGLGVVSAGAAIATKGLIELDNTMAQFTADTGLAGEAADKAKKSILSLSGRNLQPMKEIGAVMGKVHTDLGLTGDAADETAEKFLHFARITKRDASEEVAAFDDILDAWGLTADKSGGIMDQLVLSHQKFGGSITDDEAALKTLAPAMKALNFDIDDSIGLLNLFKSKGLDASAAQRAFNTAVKNLPPGTKLEDVLEKIQAIEDPSLRAAAAIEVFGSKGGVALANALGPGIGSLDDFTVTTDEANGAMERGREAIDGTFGAQAQLLLKGFTTKLTELGQGFGPAITGLASLGSLAGSLGFGKLGAKLSAGLAGAWKSVLSSALVSGAIAKVGSLAATLYLRALMLGDAISGAVSKAWGKIASSALVSGAISKAGGLAATAYLKTLLLGDAISGALSTAWSKTGGKALTAAGTAGSKTGLAFKIAFVAAAAFLWKEVLDTYNEQKAEIDRESKEIGVSVAEQIKTGTLEELKAGRAAVAAGIDAIAKQFENAGTLDRGILWLLTKDTLADLQNQLAAYDAGIAAADIPGELAADLAAGAPGVAAGAAALVDPAIKAFTDLGYSADQAKELVGSDARVLSGEVVGAFDVMAPKITDGAEAWQKYRDDVQAAQQKAITDQLDFTSKALSDLQGFQSGVETALSGVYSAENDATITKNRIIILEAQLTASRKEQQEKGAKITAAERADYQNNRIAIEGELEQLKLHAALIGDDMHRVTALNALLTAKDLKTNLLSENDNIRLAAEAQRDKIIGYLIDLSTQGGPAAQSAATIVAQWLNPNNSLSPLAAVDTYGQNLGTDFAGGIPLAKPALNRSLSTLLAEVKEKFTGIHTKPWGVDAAQEYADGVGSQGTYLAQKVNHYLSFMERKLEAQSPPGPDSPLHDIDKWGAKTGEAYTTPLVAQLKAMVAQARTHLADLATTLTRPMGTPALAFAAPASPIATAGAGLLGQRAVPFAGPDGFTTVGGTGGGSVTNITLPGLSLRGAETPSDVVRTLRHLNVYGTFGEERK